MAADFKIQRRVQFAETDMAGVLHFSNYFRLLEEVEHAFWRTLGLSVVLKDPAHDISWPRVAVRCEYFAPAHFEDLLELRLRLENLGEKSLCFEVEFWRGDQRLAIASATVVCCRMTGGAFRSIPIPPELREKLTPFLGANAAEPAGA